MRATATATATAPYTAPKRENRLQNTFLKFVVPALCRRKRVDFVVPALCRRKRAFEFVVPALCRRKRVDSGAGGQLFRRHSAGTTGAPRLSYCALPTTKCFSAFYKVGGACNSPDAWQEKAQRQDNAKRFDLPQFFHRGLCKLPPLWRAAETAADTAAKQENSPDLWQSPDPATGRESGGSGDGNNSSSSGRNNSGNNSSNSGGDSNNSSNNSSNKNASRASRLRPWLRFFRLPNLPTAPGDALAGVVLGSLALLANAAHHSDAANAAMSNPAISDGEMTFALWFADIAAKISATATGARFIAVFICAGLAALLLYMFGLADNDIAGADADKTAAPDRPIPAGEITLPAARRARAACLALAAICALACPAPFPTEWWLCAAALAATITLYNRFKDRACAFGLIAMGACRGLSLLAGAAAIAGIDGLLSAAVLLAALGIAAYTTAITWLAADEHKAAEALDTFRYIPGLAALIPLAALRSYPDGKSQLLLLLCCAYAYYVWARAVAPLGAPHDPASRRRAVGGAIGALLYLQAGIMLARPEPMIIAAAALLFTARAAARRLHPQISGS